MANRGRGPRVERTVEKLYPPGGDRPWTLTVDETPDDTLVHCAYIQDPTQAAPRTVRLLCGADAGGNNWVSDVEKSNCLHCNEEARKRWHI